MFYNVSVSLCRLFKEKAMYEKEVVDNQNKLEQWEAEGKEAVYLKKQVCTMLLHAG